MYHTRRLGGGVRIMKSGSDVSQLERSAGKTRHSVCPCTVVDGDDAGKTVWGRYTESHCRMGELTLRHVESLAQTSVEAYATRQYVSASDAAGCGCDATGTGGRKVFVHDEPGGQRTAQSRRQDFTRYNPGRRNPRGAFACGTRGHKELSPRANSSRREGERNQRRPPPDGSGGCGRKGRQRRCDADPAGAFRADCREWWGVSLDRQRESANVAHGYRNTVYEPRHARHSDGFPHCSDAR